jgi:hypothetical protein
MPVLWWGIKIRRPGIQTNKPTKMNPDKLTIEKLKAFARELRGCADLAARIHEDADTGESSPWAAADLLDALIGDIEDSIREVHQ